jgi:HlyD family secretion protein
LLFQIDDPELVAKLREAESGLVVASAQLANIEAGTRAEVIAQRNSAVESAAANLTLAQRTYDRVKELAGTGNAPIQRLDETTDSLQVAQRSLDQAKLAYQETVNGYTPEERGIARANVAKAQASIGTIKAQVDELVVKAPIAAQVYQIGAELGEYVSPGVPLLSLVDLSDVWLLFDLREDLAKGSKVGEQFQMRVPALGDRQITAAIKVIATKANRLDTSAGSPSRYGRIFCRV